MKKCWLCKELKNKSEFNKDLTRKDGLQNRCIPCQRTYYIEYNKRAKDKRHQYYLKNKEAYRQRAREYYRRKHEIS